MCANISGPSAAVLNLNQDGTVSLVEGSPDLAGSRTAVAMHVAEVLGIPVTDVHPSIGDSSNRLLASVAALAQNCESYLGAVSARPNIRPKIGRFRSPYARGPSSCDAE